MTEAERAAWAQWARDQAEAAIARAPRRPPKYGARRVEVDGRWFDSQKEARRYQALRQLEASGQIAALEVQPTFPLHVVELYRGSAWLVSTRLVGTYTADFQYVNLTTGEIIVEDVKSGPTRTEAYRLRKKLLEAIHGITITEV